MEEKVILKIARYEDLRRMENSYNELSKQMDELKAFTKKEIDEVISGTIDYVLAIRNELKIDDTVFTDCAKRLGITIKYQSPLGETVIGDGKGKIYLLKKDY